MKTDMAKQTNNDIVIGALRNCSQEAEVIDVFEKFDIGNAEVKRALIHKAMGDAETFYYGQNLTEDMKLIGDIAMFIDGEWRADELYELPKG